MGISKGPMVCFGAAWLACKAAAMLECADTASCNAGNTAGALMMQRTHMENSMHLSDGDFQVMEHSFLDTLSGAAGSRRNLAAMEQRAQTMAEAAVARASLDNATDNASSSTTGTPNRVGTNDSSQGGIVTTILDTLNRSIWQGMLSDHVEDQSEVDRSFKHIGDCLSDMQETNRTTIQPNKSSLKGKADASATCNSQNATAHANMISVCSAAHTHFKDNLVDTNCALSAEQTADVLKDYLGCIKLFAGRIPAAEAQYWECNNATSSFNAKFAECSIKKNANHGGYCGLKAFADATCTTYSRCYARTTNDYNTTKTSVQMVEAGRKTEAVSLARIRCYLRVILMPAWQLKGSAGAQKLTDCAGSTATSEESQLTITYAVVPTAAVCDLPGPTPGSGPSAAGC